MKNDTICPRCGSPRKISKTWTESLETFSGSSLLTMTQTICTNKDCQASFDSNRAIEIKKRDELKLKKEEHDRERRQNIVNHTNRKAA